MSSGPGSLSRHNHFDEFDTPLVTNAGILTPAQRKAAALANLGLDAVAADIDAASEFVADLTASAAEVNILDGVTATAAELNENDLNPAAVTATADGLTTGLIPLNARQILVTSSAATNMATLPGIAANSLPVGYTVRGRVTANGFELVTLASSNETINGVDSDGTNQLDIPAQGAFIAWVEAATGWAVVLTATATPDND